MVVRPRLTFALIVCGALVSACGGHGQIAGAPTSDRSGSSLGSVQEAPPSQRELAAESAARAKVDAKLRAGYMFQVSATVHGVLVAKNKEPAFRLSPGDFVVVKLVPNSEPKYIIHGNSGTTRSTHFVQSACDGCDNGGGTPPPNSGSPTPPNYGPCASSGGATWYNDSTGEGGCTPRGNTKPLSCGSWSWSARGKGTLIVPGINTPIDGLDYVIDHGDGSCRAGSVT